MNISELIAQLQRVKEVYGEMPVAIYWDKRDWVTGLEPEIQLDVHSNHCIIEPKE